MLRRQYPMLNLRPIFLMAPAAAAAALITIAAPAPLAAAATPAPVALWAPEVPFPDSIEAIEPLAYASYSLAHRADANLRFLHQSGIGFHAGELFVGWNHAFQDESAGDVRINGRRSRDGGRTWTPLETIAPELPGDERWEYCSFLSHQGRMWAFSTRAGQAWDFSEPKMEAFVFDPEEARWERRGVVLEDFVASDKIRRLANGNHIMAGMFVRAQSGNDMENRIAISAGDDLTSWRQTRIPHPPGMRWPLVSLIVDGPRVTAILRNSKDTWALVSTSEDHGETWPEARLSNMPMIAMKPFAGMLSTGQRYLISGTPPAPGDHTRSALTIAVSEPGGPHFRRIWKISRGVPYPLRYPGAAKRPQWSYPKAVEHAGHLYVIYSVHKEDAEMAIIPLESLRVDK
jgi:hypothetical protein